MTKRTLAVSAAVLVMLLVVVLAAAAVTAYLRVNSFVHDESVQRVHTIGERCEATAHQAAVLHNRLPPSARHEADWFDQSYRRCLKSLAKVEARAHVHYAP